MRQKKGFDSSKVAPSMSGFSIFFFYSIQLHSEGNIFGTVWARILFQTFLESWEGMLHGIININILTVILCPKIRCKVWLFSPQIGPTLNTVFDKTMTLEVLEINKLKTVVLRFPKISGTDIFAVFPHHQLLFLAGVGFFVFFSYLLFLFQDKAVLFPHHLMR